MNTPRKHESNQIKFEFELGKYQIRLQTQLFPGADAQWREREIQSLKRKI